MMEYKSFPAEFQIKQDDSDGMTFEGYASTFGNVDDGNDIIKRGAFKRTINNRFKRGQGSLIKVLRGHWDLIGIPIAMSEDDHGLFTESKVSHTPLGEETMVLIKDGALDRLSIGYKAIKFEKDEETDIRTLKEIKLYEYSVVEFAMNEMAQITGSKALALVRDITVREALLQLTDERIKAALEEFDPIEPSVSEDKSDNISDNGQKIQNTISALRDTATALEGLLSVDSSKDTPSEDVGIDPVVLHSMLNEIKDVTKTFSLQT